MKFNALLIASAALAMGAVGFTGNAYASDGSINLSRLKAVQAQMGDVNQISVAATLAVGDVGDVNDLSSVSANITNNASLNNTLDQSASMLDVNAAVTTATQTISGKLTQASAAIVGTGAIGDKNTFSSVSANIGNNLNQVGKVKMD